MLEMTHYQPGGGYMGTGLSDVPGRILIADGRISYSRCLQYGVAFFRIDVAGRLTKTGGAKLPAAPRQCRELSAPPDVPTLPALWDLMRLLHGSPAIERTGEASLLLSTDELGLLITKAPCHNLVQSDDHRTSTGRDCASKA